MPRAALRAAARTRRRPDVALPPTPAAPRPAAPRAARDPAVQLRRALRLGHRVEGAAVQRALPPGAADTKNLYSAQKRAQNLRYAGGRPSKFSTGFKQKLLDHWRGTYNIVTQDEGGKPQNVLVKGRELNYWVPVTAFQIDHHQAWDVIEKTKLPNAAAELQGGLVNDKLPSGFHADAFRPVWVEENGTTSIKPAKRKTRSTSSKRGSTKSKRRTTRSKKTRTTWPPAWAGTGKNAGTWPSTLTEKANQAVRDYDIKVEPTIWGARMYYHDVDNLVPMAGSENASKSSAVVGESTGRDVIEETDTHVVSLGGELAELSSEIGRKFDLISKNIRTFVIAMPGAYSQLIVELDDFLEEMRGFSDYLGPLHDTVLKEKKKRKRKLNRQSSDRTTKKKKTL